MKSNAKENQCCVTEHHWKSLKYIEMHWKYTAQHAIFAHRRWDMWWGAANQIIKSNHQIKSSNQSVAFWRNLVAAGHMRRGTWAKIYENLWKSKKSCQSALFESSARFDPVPLRDHWTSPWGEHTAGVGIVGEDPYFRLMLNRLSTDAR